MRHTRLWIYALTVLGALNTVAGARETVTAAPEDVASPDAIIKAVYDVISGSAGETRNWDRFRSLFAPNARLIAVRGSAPGGFTLNGTVEDYIKGASSAFDKDGFFEREIARKTDRFGNIVQAFSTYAAFRAATDEKPFLRGINSFQIAYDGTRWSVVTIFWQAETADHPIPEKYLSSNDKSAARSEPFTNEHRFFVPTLEKPRSKAGTLNPPKLTQP